MLIIGLIAALASIPLFLLVYGLIGLLMLTGYVSIVLEGLIDFFGSLLDSQLEVVEKIFPGRDKN
jgi:hypothetical protein